MRASIRSWVTRAALALALCGGLASAGAQPAGDAPRAAKVPPAAQLLASARELEARLEYKEALALVDQGLAQAPQSLPLLKLRADVLMKLRDFARALPAYEAYLAAGPPAGRARRDAEGAVAQLRRDLEDLKTTGVEVTVSSGPADVYLGSRALGVRCVASPACTQPELPGTYRVIVERPGYEPARTQVTIEKGAIAKVSVALVPKPSPLTVTAPAGAVIEVNGAPPGPTVPAGKHRVVVKLEGHADEVVEVEARPGQPLEVTVEPARLYALRVSPAGARLTVDGAPARIVEGKLALRAGPRAIVGTAPGHRERRVELAADRAPDTVVAVELPGLAVAASAAPRGTLTLRRKVAVGVAGASVAALGAAVVLGLSSSSLEDDAFALCPSATVACAAAGEATDLNERAQSRALQANLAYSVAGVAAISAAILWLTGAPGGDRAEGRELAVMPRLGAAPGVDVSLRF